MAIDRTSSGDAEWETTLSVSDADEDGICTAVASGSVPSGILAAARAEEKRRITLARPLETAPRLQ